jgi:hypothetical protein
LEESARHEEDRLSKLVDSLEIVTSRLLEMTVSNNQIATSQTPEMRGLFDTWIKYISDEILRTAEGDRTMDIGKIAKEAGISSSSLISLLAYLERRGALAITHVVTAEGDGRNKDICGCLS